MAIASLADIAAATAEREPQRIAIDDGRRRVTYGQLSSSASRFAGFLGTSGVHRGARVAICLRNQVEFMEAHLGILQAGCVSVPIPPESTDAELDAYLSDAEPMVFIASPSVVERQSRPAVDLLRLTDSPCSIPGVLTLADAIAGASGEPAPPRSEPNALAVLLYTTGTSARPKAVMLSHQNTLAAIRNEISIVGQNAERELVVLPLWHSYGLGQVYCNLATSGTVFLRNGLTRLGRILDLLHAERITAFACTPTGYKLILERGGEAFQKAGQFLTQSVVNSSPLSRPLAERLRQVLPQLRIFVYYGLTEASRTTFLSLNDVAPEKYESVGVPAPGVQVRVVRQSGASAAIGEEGEIVVSGDTVALGYWRRPEETSATFTANQLRTGDVGTFDQAGNLWLRGRLKDFINVGGLKVSPSEVEQSLGTHPSVADCAVCAVPDTLTGEAVAAMIVLKPNELVNTEALETHCATTLEHFKVPKIWVMADVVPRTDSGKAIRRDVEAHVRTTLHLER